MQLNAKYNRSGVFTDLLKIMWLNSNVPLDSEHLTFSPPEITFAFPHFGLLNWNFDLKFQWRDYEKLNCELLMVNLTTHAGSL